jgi:glutaredoxin
MKEKALGFFACTLLLLSFIATISSANVQKQSFDHDPINPDYSHTMLGEYFTLTTCVPCKFTHQALKELFAENYHPFYYITYVANKNAHSKMRKSELQVVGTPTVVWDGGYEKNTIIYNASVELWKTKFNESILSCDARDVKDIDLSLEVEWLGAINNHPEDGKINVPIEAILNWTVTEMVINVVAINNEASEYNGHIHIQIAENESSLWDDKFGKPYTHEFKDYAFNDDVTLDPGETWSKTIFWDGMDYDDGGGDDWEPHIFDYIKQENTWVIASAMDKDSNKWVDETAGFRAGEEGTEPKIFDVYFGDSYPPSKVISNGTSNKYDPSPFGNLNWSTKYYWKVDVWNAKGEKTPGQDWNFTTRGNSPPNIPIGIEPNNQSTDASIDTNLTWIGGDPDFDEVKYDIYFGEFDLMEKPPIVENNWTETTFDPTPYGQTLDFETKYEWRIVAWDEYGERTEGDWWWFITEPNYPPNPAKDPRPKDGEQKVPVNASLFWNGTDPNSGDTLKYDVYFGLYDPPTLLEHNQSESSYDPYGDDDMQLYETYYWKIVTWDKKGKRSENNKVWVFETGVNLPPTDPEIDGPTRGKPNIVYNFTFVSTDPDNNSIKYIIDWGDKSSNETILYESEEVVTLSHSWGNKSKYTIKARAIDEYGARSELSQHVIDIPRNRAFNNNNFIFIWLKQRFPNIFPLLRYILGFQ